MLSNIMQMENRLSLFLLAFALRSCGRSTSKQVEIENLKQFKEEFIKELTNKINLQFA